MNDLQTPGAKEAMVATEGGCVLLVLNSELYKGSNTVFMAVGEESGGARRRRRRREEELGLTWMSRGGEGIIRSLYLSPMEGRPSSADFVQALSHKILGTASNKDEEKKEDKKESQDGDKKVKDEKKEEKEVKDEKKEEKEETKVRPTRSSSMKPDSCVQEETAAAAAVESTSG
eukprot:126523-Hanusia_phi.AAC.2